jgi:predicted nucleic acid-binding protein
MGGRYVLDASVAAKVFLSEAGSDAARQLVRGADQLIAPDLVLLELASVTVKKTRRQELAPALAREIVADAPDLFDRLAPTRDLIAPAQELALRAMVAVQDAVYAVLAVREGLTLATADARLAGALAGMKDAPAVELVGA